MSSRDGRPSACCSPLRTRVSKAWRASTDGYGVWRFPNAAELPFVLLLDDPPRVGVQVLRRRIISLPDPAMSSSGRAGFPDEVVTLIWCAMLRREQIIRRVIAGHLGNFTGMLVVLACAEYAATVVGGPAWAGMDTEGRAAPSPARTPHPR